MPNFSGVWNLKEQIQAIAAGRWTGVPLPELYAWGNNSGGQIGDNTVVSKSSPVQVGELTDWDKISTNSNHSLSVKTDGTLWGWGRGDNGKIGDGTTARRSSPVQIGALANWQQVSAGKDHSVAVKTTGTAWTWGRGSSGQTGLNNNDATLNSPVQIGALTNWRELSGGDSHTVALKTDGTLWAWGSNGSGQLGINTGYLDDRSSPVQVGALTTWAQVDAGTSHSAAIKTDGTLWTWGSNSNGNLGDGSQVQRSSPVQVGALTNWSSINAGNVFTSSVKTDGTLWAWGSGGSGRLGHNDTVSRSSPVQVGALTNWSKVSGKIIHQSAVKTDGTLWAWGYNGSGRLGDNTTVSKSSPVQIGALTNWSNVAAGGYVTLAISLGSSN